ncbi:unnamed protein product [Medioppia subpectinata]|uniref:Uncharacterized protein n=1 Tax=Medioppia subpectinata TaxID=1979941 RepID=A0A7R9Q6C7_9ACAR|nr:unnamed protein product [Medioppia subpectinata]CAG2114269.1 unnamed protein product [Medioppia subpectinata]
MDYTLDIYLRQSWNDQRLVFDGNNTVDEIVIGGEFVRRLWLPDTFIVNSKHMTLHTNTRQETNTLFRIRPNGDVFYSIRLTAVNLCQMNLVYFPMDQQICDLVLESYSYSVDDIEYNWEQNNSISDGISLPNFKIEGYKMDKYISYSALGGYWQLKFEIIFKRSIAYYISQVYLPAFMIVVVSWLPFWLNPADSVARVGLGITTVLTMTTLVTNTNESLPKISYTKSIDIYLSVSYALVFLALLEYAIVGHFERVRSQKLIDRYSRGRVVVALNTTLYQFQGIPYAEPPIGALRFAKEVLFVVPNYNYPLMY